MRDARVARSEQSQTLRNRISVAYRCVLLGLYLALYLLDPYRTGYLDSTDCKLHFYPKILIIFEGMSCSFELAIPNSFLLTETAESV